MQEQLQKLAVSKQEVLHCLGIVGAGFLYSLGINLFVVPAGLYTGGIILQDKADRSGESGCRQ